MDYIFNCGFSAKSDLCNSTVKKHLGIIRIQQFLTLKKDNFLHIFDQIKVKGYRCESAIAFFALWARHLKLRLQSR